jgi:hypothetical protein
MTDKGSTVFNHINEMQHQMDLENMEIIDSARDDYRLRLKDMLYISKLKPKLNVQKNLQMFSLLLSQGNGS